MVMIPQVCIGALGKIQRLPRFCPADPQKVVPAHILHVSWAADHRLIDGPQQPPGRPLPGCLAAWLPGCDPLPAAGCSAAGCLAASY